MFRGQNVVRAHRYTKLKNSVPPYWKDTVYLSRFTYLIKYASYVSYIKGERESHPLLQMNYQLEHN